MYIHIKLHTSFTTYRKVDSRFKIANFFHIPCIGKYFQKKKHYYTFDMCNIMAKCPFVYWTEVLDLCTRDIWLRYCVYNWLFWTSFQWTAKTCIKLNRRSLCDHIQCILSDSSLVIVLKECLSALKMFSFPTW